MWLNIFHKNAFNGPEIDGNPIVYAHDLIFDSRMQAVHHVIRTRENYRQNKH